MNLPLWLLHFDSKQSWLSKYLNSTCIRLDVSIVRLTISHLALPIFQSPDALWEDASRATSWVNFANFIRNHPTFAPCMASLCVLMHCSLICKNLSWEAESKNKLWWRIEFKQCYKKGNKLWQARFGQLCNIGRCPGRLSIQTEETWINSIWKSGN